MQVKTSNLMDIKYCLRIMVSTMHYEGKFYSMFLHICCISEIIHNNVHEKIKKCTLEKGNVLLALQSTGKSCFIGLVLYCCCTFSLGLFPVEHHHHPIFLQLKHNVFVLYFVIQKFSTILYNVLLHKNVAGGTFYRTFNDIFPRCRLFESTANEHPLFNRLHSSHTLSTHYP